MRFILTLCATIALGGSASAQQQEPSRPLADSLRLTRRQAIAEALNRNAQLDVARQQTAQARARRIEAIAIPDPTLAASYDEQSRLFNFGRGAARNVGIGIAIPFIDKFRLRNNVARADIGAFESNYRLQTQLIAAQTSMQYDSLLVARKHRDVLLEGRTLSADFSNARRRATLPEPRPSSTSSKPRSISRKPRTA